MNSTIVKSFNINVKSLVSPTIVSKLNKLIEWLVEINTLRVITKCYPYLYFNVQTTNHFLIEELYLHYLNYHYRSFPVCKIILKSPCKENELHCYLDIETITKGDVKNNQLPSNFYIEFEFDLTSDPQTEKEKSLSYLFNLSHRCFELKEEYVLNVVGQGSTLHLELLGQIQQKVMECLVA